MRRGSGDNSEEGADGFGDIPCPDEDDGEGLGFARDSSQMDVPPRIPPITTAYRNVIKLRVIPVLASENVGQDFGFDKLIGGSLGP